MRQYGPDSSVRHINVGSFYAVVTHIGDSEDPPDGYVVYAAGKCHAAMVAGRWNALDWQAYSDDNAFMPPAFGMYNGVVPKVVLLRRATREEARVIDQTYAVPLAWSFGELARMGDGEANEFLEEIFRLAIQKTYRGD